MMAAIILKFTSGILEMQGIIRRRVECLCGVDGWGFEGIAGDIVKGISEFAGLELCLCCVKTVQLQFSTAL